MGFYNAEELKNIGFKYVGSNVRLSKKASIYNAQYISIGDNSRIDDFCVLSAGVGEISIGRYVHIAVYTSLIGKANITVDDFANLSSKVAIYSANDDYSGQHMTNPTVPESYTNVSYKPVYIGKHAIIGAGSVVLPGVNLEEGVAIGSLSLVNRNCEGFTIYAGSPLKFIKNRSKNILDLERKLEFERASKEQDK